MRAKIVTALALAALTLTACTAPRAPQFTPIPSSASSSPTVVNEVPVHIYASSFSPAALTVKPGTTVIWTNKSDTMHIVASDDGSWLSESLAGGQTYEHLFDRPGTFSYHCDVHWFMKGTIIVQP